MIQPGRWWTFARSLCAGGAATLVDLAALGLLVGLGVSARAANLPALVLGAIVQFAGNRRFVFATARTGCMWRQLGLFALAELVALGLNGWLYDAVARQVVLGVAGALALRAAVSCAVFVAWSYPLWRKIFGSASQAEQAARLV